MQKTAVLSLRCCVKGKTKNWMTEGEQKLPTLLYEYPFALSVLRTKVKFHNLLPVLDPKNESPKTTAKLIATTCIAFS